MNFTLSPDAAKVLQEMSENLDRTMSSIVETSMLWVLLDKHFEEASAWAVRRSIQAIDAAFGDQLTWHEELKRERGIPQSQQLYPAIMAFNRRRFGRPPKEGDESFTEEDYLRERKQQEEDIERGVSLGKIKVDFPLDS